VIRRLRQRLTARAINPAIEPPASATIGRKSRNRALCTRTDQRVLLEIATGELRLVFARFFAVHGRAVNNRSNVHMLQCARMKVRVPRFNPRRLRRANLSCPEILCSMRLRVARVESIRCRSQAQSNCFRFCGREENPFALTICFYARRNSEDGNGRDSKRDNNYAKGSRRSNGYSNTERRKSSLFKSPYLGYANLFYIS